jgi:hypothetical protein
MAVVTCCCEFFSDQFLIDPAETEETSPGRYGRALAEWLRDGLVPDGEAVAAHPWGWRVMLQREPFGLRIGCSNITDLRASPLPPQPVAWSCVVVAEFSVWTSCFFWHRVIGGESPDRDIRAAASRLGALLRSNPRIRDLEGYEHY